ncbi:unnamed protein product [Phytophthora lilii]|uniref:glucan endo-1,3-beta-D-glucosidase n=1 Tax=Phytophthora lilii TaxID=2077276 RepID=A0A9W6UBQ1_9STRA|nr:unnamed protein product [Phytophthora lilii]
MRIVPIICRELVGSVMASGYRTTSVSTHFPFLHGEETTPPLTTILVLSTHSSKMKLFLPTLIASVVLILNGGADALNVKVPGVNYSAQKGPDWAADKCKTASEVQKDMYALKGIANKVRIHSLEGCNTAELVLPAAKNA